MSSEQAEVRVGRCCLPTAAHAHPTSRALDEETYIFQEPQGRAQTICPRKWIHHRGNCYGYFTQRKTQAQAEEECSRYGPMATLASIHSEGSSIVLGEYVASQEDGAYVWIGLKDEERNGRWKWSDNSVLDYLHWGSYQPSYSGYCVALGNSRGFEYWYNYPCSYQFPFLCQYQA
ncbi:C-type lectin Cal-like [Cuculus canorus]|uniref:C-type lectin Cal-like n=1 Tax=Cuculus canorus TaxID=55661 RepID=UPI0023AAC8CC|nr:C-type lectin Cal-like [Cuculus canorus]